MLASLSCPRQRRALDWDLQGAAAATFRTGATWLIRSYGDLFAQVADKLPGLRCSLIHNEGNDSNVLVGPPAWERQLVGVLDFGDMVVTYTVAEVAVAAAHAMAHSKDPVGAAAEVAAGYHAVFPLQEDELKVLYPLMCMRFCLRACLGVASAGW